MVESVKKWNNYGYYDHEILMKYFQKVAIIIIIMVKGKFWPYDMQGNTPRDQNKEAS